MRTIAIGDIHGSITELNKLLNDIIEKEIYTPNIDKLIFLGDYIDRGENSRLVIRKIRELQDTYDNVIALMGNHEDMAIEYYDGYGENWLYSGNGNNATLDSYKGYFEEFISDLAWMKTLPLYHEDDNFIYVHAGIDVNKPLAEQDRNDLLWIRDKFIYSLKELDKKVVFGHTPTFFLTNDNKPVYTVTRNINIDTGCVYDGGALTALIINEGTVEGFYQIERKETKENEE